MRHILAVTIILTTSQTAVASDGRTLLNACKEFLQARITDQGIEMPPTYQAGFCFGSMQMLQGLGNVWIVSDKQPALRICAPSEVRTSQYAGVVVRYLEQHPETLHESGEILALTAVTAAFPCPADPSQAGK